MRAMTSADWNSRYAATDFVWSTTPNQFLVEEVADLTPGRDWLGVVLHTKSVAA